MQSLCQRGANPSPTCGRRQPREARSDEGSRGVPTKSRRPVRPLLRKGHLLRRKPGVPGLRIINAEVGNSRLRSGRRRDPPIFQAALAHILIIRPMKQSRPHACGSPAPALTLGPKRTWRNGRRSRLQLECPRGNPRRRTAQIRGTLKAERPKPIPSQARIPGRCKTRRGAPKAAGPRRRDSPDHERPFFKGRRRKPKRQENLLLARECGFESRRPHQWGARN